MRQRTIGPFQVSAISAGCMSLSHGYGPAPDEAMATRVLNHAIDSGYTMLDTAALYGFGANETLIGKAVSHRRHEFVLASKGGIFRNADGVREIDGSPETLRQSIDASLRRLQTDVIDLYYLHRWDKRIPVEESIAVLAEAVVAGKIRTIGLSEVSSDTLRRAHAVHPITAVQSEYSLWTRNPEIEILKTCRELGAQFVAFSPLARQFLTGKLTDLAQLADGDLRRAMPRFQAQTYRENLKLLADYQALAGQAGVTPAQLALAWVLAQGEDIIPIPGTTKIEHLDENAGAADVELSAEIITSLDALINEHTVHGPRYNARNQGEVDSAEYPHHVLTA